MNNCLNFAKTGISRRVKYQRRGQKEAEIGNSGHACANLPLIGANRRNLAEFCFRLSALNNANRSATGRESESGGADKGVHESITA